MQAELRQAAAVQEEEREAREALKLQHEAELRHLKTEHAAQFASAHAQVRRNGGAAGCNKLRRPDLSQP